MKNATLSQFPRFVLVGLFNTLNGFLLLNFFAFGLKIDPIAANILSIGIAMALSFVLNLKFVFRHKLSRKTHQVLTLFIICTLFSQLIVQQAVFSASFRILESWFHGSDTYIFSGMFYAVNISKLLAVGVSVAVTYYLYKYIVFKAPKHEEISKS